MSAANAIAAPTTTWNIDPVHSTAEFKVKHMMISNVKGQFSAIGVISLDEYDVTKSQVEASIEVGSINTHNPDRDAHLKSADFFDVQTFPILSFSSTRVSPKGEGELTVEGNPTIRGVPRQVAFALEGPTAPATDPWGNTRIGMSATTKISRKDFG